MPERLGIEPPKEPRLLEMPEKSGQKPEIVEAGPGQLTEFIKIGNSIASSYPSLSPERKKAAANFFASYKNYLKLRFQNHLQGKEALTPEMEEGFFQHLIEVELQQYPAFLKEVEGFYLTPEAMQFALIDLLNNEVKDTKDARELCKKLGIEYQEMKESLVGIRTPRTKPVERREQAQENDPQNREKNKLLELLPYLIAQGISADTIKVTKGSIKRIVGRDKVNPSKRKIPYLLVELAGLNKQILICNHLGDAAFVSQESLPIDTLENAAKPQLTEQLGLTKVSYDQNNNWLKKITKLLLEGKKNIEEIKARILNKFSRAQDFLSLVGSEQKLSILSKTDVVMLTGKSIEGTPSNLEIVRCGMIIYGKDEPNLLYAEKIELEDAGYIASVIKNGLPKGVDYFLPKVEANANKATEEPTPGTPTDIDFAKRYLSNGFNSIKTQARLLKNLNVGVNTFVKLFAPENYKRAYELARQKLAYQSEGQLSVNMTSADLYTACKAVYPEGHQFQYMMDLNNPEKLIQIIRGEYEIDLNLVNGVDSRLGVYKLDIKRFPTFEEFRQEIIKKNNGSINEVSGALNRTFGFGMYHLGGKLGIQLDQHNRNISKIYAILQKVYPESTAEIQLLIDTRHPAPKSKA